MALLRALSSPYGGTPGRPSQSLEALADKRRPAPARMGGAGQNLAAGPGTELRAALSSDLRLWPGFFETKMEVHRLP